MKQIKTYSDSEIEAAKYVLEHYRENFPDFDNIEDDVIKNDIIRCKEILSYAKIIVEEITPEPKNNLPWFLKGPKSQNFKYQLEECIRQGAYGEIKELREEISRMKNKFAYRRYLNIFNYVVNNSK